MADNTTITFDGELLSPEQQNKIVKPIKDLLTGLQRQVASADKARGGKTVVGGKPDEPVVGEEKVKSSAGL